MTLTTQQPVEVGPGPGGPRLSVTVVWVATLAEQEARELDHRRLGTEHLLLALVRMGDPVGRRLAERGATLLAVRRGVVRLGAPGPLDDAHGRPGWSTAASAVLAAARASATAHDRSEVTTVDLAAAMLAPGGRTATLLARLGVDAEELRGALVPPRVLRSAPGGRHAADRLLPARDDAPVAPEVPDELVA